MNGNTWLESLPQNIGIERDNKILQAIDDNLVVCDWSKITSTIKNHEAVFEVLSDAAYVLLEDNSRFRFPVSSRLARSCANKLNSSLITTKISDLAYQQAEVVLSATTLPFGSDIATINKSKLWNSKIEKKRNGKTGLIRDCGKTWILSNKAKSFTSAINYGFYDIHAPYKNKIGISMWQTEGLRHNDQHSDYSQTLILMKNTCLIDNQEMLVRDVMIDFELSYLINYDGILHI